MSFPVWNLCFVIVSGLSGLEAGPGKLELLFSWKEGGNKKNKTLQNVSGNWISFVFVVHADVHSSKIGVHPQSRFGTTVPESSFASNIHTHTHQLKF